MKKPRRKKGKLVQIVWQDIQTRAGWQSAEPGKLKNLPNYGVLVRRDKETITISYGLDPETGLWADPTDYPMGCVKAVIVLMEVPLELPDDWKKGD